MAIHIAIRKTDEDDTGATYAFGPLEGHIGAVFVEKATLQVTLLQIDDPTKQEFYLSRVRRALQCHLESGELPESTWYAA